MRKIIELSGKFGRWTIVARYPKRGRWHGDLWFCVCDCGIERVVPGRNLRAGKSRSCGCGKRDALRKRMTTHELTGTRFGRWRIIARHPERGRWGEDLWSCVCDCGIKRVVSGRSLRTGKSVSCGCAKRDALRKRKTTHGQTGTRIYQCWKDMKQRCFNPRNAGYRYYGERGIGVHEDWRKDFLAFFADVLDAPHGLSLDRINNNGNYEPGNVRWATPLEQVHNRRPQRRSKVNSKPRRNQCWSRQ